MNNQLIVRLPEFYPKYVVQTMSEVYDWGLRDLNIPDIHKETMGEGITIGVIDSGKPDHFDVINNICGAINLSDSNSEMDFVGHQTAVSGIIAAEKNDQGVIGVAPKSKIYSIKSIGDGGTGDTAALTKGILTAIEQKVDIISISAGIFVDFKPMHEAVKQAYKNNIIIICACGNSADREYDVAFPARYPETIGVAAYDKKHKIAPFSSRGTNIAFALPGVDIYSTYLNNSYSTVSGTSFSAPLLSGICALILSKHRQSGIINKTPCDTPKQMMEHLMKFAVDLGEGKNVSGFGTVDVKSMFLEENSTPEPLLAPTVILVPEPAQIQPTELPVNTVHMPMAANLPPSRISIQKWYQDFLKRKNRR